MIGLKKAVSAGVALAGLSLGLAVLVHAQALALPGGGDTLYALTAANELLRFGSNRPLIILQRTAITGLAPKEELLCIDFRPANGWMYGVGSTNRVYTIDPNSGVAVAVNPQPFTPALQGSEFGCDVNPVVDRLRVVSNAGQNLRLNMDTGTVVDGNNNPADGIQPDGSLAYNPGNPAAGVPADVNAGITPVVSAAAYTNNDNDPATGTTLFDIDRRLDVLATQNPPNAGTLNTQGALGVDAITELAGFDITPAGTAYAALVVQSKSVPVFGLSRLVTIDLASGRANDLGGIRSLSPIRGLAAPAP